MTTTPQARTGWRFQNLNAQRHDCAAVLELVGALNVTEYIRNMPPRTGPASSGLFRFPDLSGFIARRLAAGGMDRDHGER